MKKITAFVLAVLMLSSAAVCANAEVSPAKRMGNFGSWVSDTASGAWDWTKGAANDAAGAASDAWGWTKDKASGALDWTKDTASGAWNGIDDFFNPPEINTNASIPAEPELPAGTQVMYLGYEVQRTGLDNGYSGSKSIGRDDPHLGWSLGKFYVSGYTAAITDSNNEFIFLKNVGDDVELHFMLTQDIDMLNDDALTTINVDDNGYDKYFGIPTSNMGRGALIVRHIDYQNNPSEPQIYADYLTAKMTGSADTVISLNEEGDYEIALDYEIRRDVRLLGTAATKTDYGDYRLFFKFSIRNGNCMVFPFDVVTGEELKNTAATENGFRLDLALSRYLDINVRFSVLTEGAGGVVEDVRYNRPAVDGAEYTGEGIYTITVHNRYTDEETVKQLYVGSDARLAEYINKGCSMDEIIQNVNQE